MSTTRTSDDSSALHLNAPAPKNTTTDNSTTDNSSPDGSAPDTAATPVDRPNRVMGTEQEYKWRVEATELFGTSEPSLEGLEHALPWPERSRLEHRFRHLQSTIYFDDDWQLADDRIALRATVNPGGTSEVAWIGVKQTIVWEDGCRDSLEVSERVAPMGISRELDVQASLPLQYVSRLVRRPIRPVEYACVVQTRYKLFFRSPNDMLLQLTFDTAEFRPLAGEDREPVPTCWLEVENNTRDLRARHELEAWAADITATLGRRPAEQAKSEFAARLLGWEPAL